MRTVQEGGVGNSPAIGHPRLRQGALGINNHDLKSFFRLAQRSWKTLPVDDQAGIIELFGMDRGEVLAVPAGKVRNRFCHLKYRPFLRQGFAEGGQGVTQSQTGQEETRLACPAERLGSKAAQFRGPVVGKGALQRDPGRLQIKFTVMFHQGEGNTVRRACFGKGVGGLHGDGPQCRDRRAEFDPKVEASWPQ